MDIGIKLHRVLLAPVFSFLPNTSYLFSFFTCLYQAEQMAEKDSTDSTNRHNVDSDITAQWCKQPHVNPEATSAASVTSTQLVRPRKSLADCRESSVSKEQSQAWPMLHNSKNVKQSLYYESMT